MFRFAIEAVNYGPSFADFRLLPILLQRLAVRAARQGLLSVIILWLNNKKQGKIGSSQSLL
jgi:hypothetical protein